MENNCRQLFKNNHQYNNPKLESQMLKEKYKSLTEIKAFVKDNKTFNDDFEILNYINSGACGIVYEGALKKSKYQKVALKFIFNKMLNNKRERIRVVGKEKIFNQINKEITLQNKLKHKNIITLYAVYEMPNDSSCISMELAHHGDLEFFQNKVHKKTLSETILGYITKQILDGLYYCHQSKIIHMDIKHQNILLDDNLRIKIADLSVSFSYAGFAPNTDITLPLAGTSLFMSPEVLGKKEIKVENCNKIDMFSLGTLLYNLAFCEYPYGLEYSDKRNFEKIKEKIAKNDLMFPGDEHYSQMFRNFIVGLLNKNINKRFSIDEAMKDPWIKGVNLIIYEKEKIGRNEKFLIDLITDNIKPFNDYIYK